MARSTDPRFTTDDVRLGNVSGMHGVQGEVKVFLYNPLTELFDAPRDVTLVGPDGARKRLRMTLRRGAGRRILGRLTDVSDRLEAAALMGFELVLPRSALPPPEAGSWYHRDLLGLPVVTEDGRELGVVREIHDTGEVDVWLLKGPLGERVLPVLAGVVLSVTVATADGPGRILVTDDAVDDRPPI